MNFFVGENSTGKSSVLSIIKLLTSNSFWQSDDFNTEEIELGIFNELVSDKKGKNREFQLGFKNTEQKINLFYSHVLATYRSKNGSPKMYQLRVLVNNLSFLFFLDKKKIKYKIKLYNSFQAKDDFSDLKAWIEDSDFSAEKYRPYTNDDWPEQPYMFDIRRIIRNELPRNIRYDTPSRFNFLPLLTWIAPIRSKPKRIYESFKVIYSSDGNHTPFLIKQILSNILKKNVTKTAFREIMEKFGRESQLFDKVEINNLGKDSASPFILNI